ncbi:SIR2 family protein [Inediibacterium massiliense]|uniref:SIR2 family protein n=1 Tax=Inediibacterium massiliense TaxID=1658111 RepID=UPI0006B4F53D|nr:SIR2 family protein [Inediibacterium massiliense]
MIVNWPENLLEEIAAQRCILFIGSGLTSTCVDEGGRRPPGWEQFIRNFLDEIKKGHTVEENISFIENMLKQKNYLMALQGIYNNIDPGMYSRFLKRQFMLNGYTESSAYKDIIKLNCKITVTTNFDKMLDKHYHNDNFVVADYHDTSRIISNIKAPQNILIKAHGTIDNTNKMIFTNQQYFKARTENPQFYKILEALFLTNTVLFIGYSMNDPDIHLILEALSHVSADSSPHYILTEQNSYPSQITEYWNNAFNLNTITYTGKNYENFLQAISTLVKEVDQFRL